MEKADVIPFLISVPNFAGGLTKCAQIAVIVADSLRVDFDKLGVIESPQGVTLLLAIEETIDEMSFLDLESHYKAVCSSLTTRLRAEQITGAIVEESTWNKQTIIACPGSTGVILHMGDMKAQDFSLLYASELNTTAQGEELPPDYINAFPKPDTAAVLEGCVFLRERARQKNLTVVERKAALSLLSYVAGKGSNESLDKVHEYAAKWSNYNREDVSREIAKALAFGPRTCVNVDKVCATSSVCKGCPYWGKINSPVQIKGENFVSTESTGFHHISVNEKGVSKKTPDYEGLRRHFKNIATYFTAADSETTFRWSGKIWEPVFDLNIKGFAQKKFKPMANTTMTNEFLGLVQRTELKLHSWLNESINNKMNFQNGVLDIKTMEFEGHDPKYGFRTVLPYDYDPSATCPRFEQFLREVTLDRPELIDIILEFAGYSLSGDKCWEQKAIVLLGEGQNGKSKLVTIIKALAGEGASTSQTFEDLEEPQNRAALDGSLFNIAEETPSKSLMDSSLFKALIGGAEVSVKRVYKNPYEIRNRAKFWMLCNEMPRSADKAHAMLRRLCIVPFDARFEGAADDKRIEEKLLPELPGILNLVLKSYKTMLARGGLPDSEIAKEKLNQYRFENDNVWRWFSECTEDLGPSSEYPSRPRELYASYKKYVEDQGEKPTTNPSFIKRLAMIWKPYAQRMGRKTLGPFLGQERVILGLKVKNEYAVRLVTLVPDRT